MARNRKRARDRRPDRPANASALATAGGDPLDAPEPLEHATPDSELAEAQLAVGRPDGEEVPDEDELEAFEAAGDGHAGGASAAGGGGGGGDLPAPAPGHEPVRAARESLLARMLTFLRGSWRELQRVQWPDRRQVMQATGVVIGFVIVAGVFLGVADVVAQKIVNLILYGHG